ncbi:MAG: hypothetical protein WAO15_16365 [Mycobacterium sp.]
MIPGWRKPIALVGWGALITVLIGLIVYGIVQLTQDRPTPAAVMTTLPTTTATDTGASTTKSVSPGALGHLPSVSTLPSLPTVITLPPGL